MRIVLKPVGLISILVAFTALIGIVFWRARNASSDTPPPVAPRPDAAAAARATAAGGMTDSASTPAAKPALPAGVLLEPDITSNEWQTFTEKMIVEQTVVPASVPGHPRARHIVIKSVGKNPWDIQLAHMLNVPFKKGKRIRLSFWARSKDSCTLTAVVEQNTDPYTRVISQNEKLTPQWKQYSVEWVQASDTPDDWAKMDFQLSYKVGVIELTGVIIRQVD